MGQSYSPIPENKTAGIFLDAALKYHAAGLKVIPFWNKAEGKKDFPTGYAKYREAQTEDDVKRLFSNNPDGVCLLCVDGIEAVDVDVKHDPAGTILKDLLTALDDYDLVVHGVVQQTKSGGAHMIYRCPNPEGNQKLAKRRGAAEAMLETRGRGGLLFVAPTPGYEILSGDLTQIPNASQEARDSLIQICRTLNESPDLIPYAAKYSKAGQKGGITPWDDYDEQTEVLDLLEAAGWTRVSENSDFIRLNRPDAKHSRGIDGSVIRPANLFFPFTTSTDFQPNKCYSPSAVFAVLECRGDFSEAGRKLRSMGFGDQPNKQSGNAKGGDDEPKPKAGQPSDILAKLAASHQKIIDAAAKDIVWTPAWITLDDAPIFSKGTINVIQGKAGVHKSRLAETLCALLLAPRGQGDYLGFSRYNLGGGYFVAYIDTERNTQEHFPAAVQRIRERAGLDKKADNGRFFPVSIKQIDRKQRLAAVRTWIEHVRGKMAERQVSDWDLFVVLDVVTDCVASFNRDEETMALFDYLGDLCELHGVTFLLILHENPGSEKARGHTGTEAMNKADTQIQIGYDSSTSGDESDIIKVRFLKTRNAARPKPLYLQYSKDKNGLVVADPDEVNEHLEKKRKSKDEELLVDALVSMFDAKAEISQQEIISAVGDACNWSQNTILSKLKNLMDNGVPIKNKAGAQCRLSKNSQPGKPSFYYLELMEAAPAKAETDATQNSVPPNDDEPPF